MNNIKDLPVNDRPYEKCFAKGPEYLTDVELLAVILLSSPLYIKQ